MKFLTAILMLFTVVCASSLAAEPALADGTAQDKPTLAAAEAALALASKGGPATVLLAVGNDASMNRAVETWRTFLKDRGFDVQVVPPSEKPDLPQAGAVIAFETESACPMAKQTGADLSELKDAGGESHIIVVQEWKGRPCVLVIGKSSRARTAAHSG